LELMGLDEALEQMPENQRRAILLREWQGLSYREIASELELSQGAVEMLIFRARRTLASALEEPAAPKRRIGKAKTGFSFGSLIAALKGLVSAGVAAPARRAATDETSASVPVPVSPRAAAVTSTPAGWSPPQQPAEPGASSAGSTDAGGSGKTNDRDRSETSSSTGSTATATPDSR